ncbi:MAG: helix-turn-helix transcriptional regulator [Mollicutes bacterium]|nr:helix-turn-helix transcriptional regulator [Mollicutes bacterium]
MKKGDSNLENVKIGDFLKEKRTKAKLTTNQLAEKLEIKEKKVIKWEEGFIIPDNITMIALSSILNFKIEDLPKISKKQKELNRMSFELINKFFKTETLLQWIIICLLSFDLMYSDTLKNYFASLDNTNFLVDGSIFLIIAIALVVVVLLTLVHTSYKIIKCEKIIDKLNQKDKDA